MPLDENYSDPNVDKSIEQTAGIVSDKQKKFDEEPVYRVMQGSKIPVSKHHGMLWQSRRDQGLQSRSSAEICWDEAIRYYNNDQTPNRKSIDNQSGNTPRAKRLNNQYTETENVVFANCSIMVPMLYSKNPNVTVTFETDALEQTGQCAERLMNKLINMKDAPGLNLKPKARRAVLTALLTNAAFVKINWIAKQDSSETAMTQLAELSKQLQDAKSKKEIQAVEGKIKALEETIDLLSPSGPVIRTLMPNKIVIDPTSVEPDGSDANWMMEWDYLPTSYINAMYGKPSGDNDQYVSVYEPTHVLSAGCDESAVEDEVNNFTLIPQGEGDNNAKAYGYQTKAQMDAASYTKVWYIWDKTTRRVFMFADNYWKWPVWVWDDPLNLPRFFPYFRLWFHETVDSNNPKGEVVYYLDQQDAINEINDEVRRARYWAKRNILYNKRMISQTDVEAFLSGPDGTAKGIALDEGVKMEDVIYSMVPPSMKFPELFNTDTKFAAINRLTGINDAMRGAQFKTNTTNKAVEAYNTNTDIRVEERIDLIEDFVGDIIHNIMMLCMMRWTPEDVVDLVGQDLAQAWKQVTDPKQFSTQMAARVEGGTIAKPNSKNRKAQAIELLQGFGQFVQASPGILIPMIKMIEQSFDEVVVSDEDWKMIIQTMMAQFQKAGAGPNGEPQQGQGQEQPDPNAPAQSDEQMKEQVKQQIASMPPQAQQMLQELVSKGMPPAQALQEVQKQLKQATGK